MCPAKLVDTFARDNFIKNGWERPIQIIFRIVGLLTDVTQYRLVQISDDIFSEAQRFFIDVKSNQPVGRVFLFYSNNSIISVS